MVIHTDTLKYVVQTDRAAMLDEIVDYVKFLRLQVKVLILKIKMELLYRKDLFYTLVPVFLQAIPCFMLG